jgi:calmodulin
MFIKYDVDNSGYLDRDEFAQLFINMSTDAVTTSDAMKVFDMIDVNNDEKVEFDEFMAIFKETQSQNDMILIEYMFKCIDKDGSGTIETEEIKKFVDDNKVNFSKEELNNLITKIDADNSGAVDLNEFKAAIYEEFKNISY